MKSFAFSFVVLLGGALALTPGCGDDSDSNDTGPAGATGKGGSTGSGKGGSASGGDSGDAGAGNASSGGETGGGGSPEGGAPAGGAPAGGAPAGGAGGAAGAGFMNPDGCPETAPATGEDCTVSLDVGSACEYPGSNCVCNGYLGGGGAGGAMAGNWACRGSGEDCPEVAPTDGDTCDSGGTQCPYPGGTECFCAGGDWDCVEPGAPGAGGAGGGGPGVIGECPDTAPEDGNACDGPIPSCFYDTDDVQCFCPANGPNADEWSCQNL